MGPSRHDTLPCGKPVGSALALAVESATKLTYFFTAVINMYRSKCRASTLKSLSDDPRLCRKWFFLHRVYGKFRDPRIKDTRCAARPAQKIPCRYSAVVQAPFTLGLAGDLLLVAGDLRVAVADAGALAATGTA